MALSRKEKIEIENTINKYKKYFDLLFHSGGALYLDEIAILTNTKYKTTSAQLKKIKESNLNLIDIYYEKNNRKIITLTRRGWITLGKNRNECLCKDATMKENLYRAYDYIHLTELRKIDKKNKELIISRVKNVTDIKTLFNHEWLEILNNFKFLILNIDENKATNIKILYYTKEVYNKELIEFMEIFYRIISYTHEDFKIDLDIITFNNINIGDTIYKITSSRTKEFMYLKNKKQGTKKLKDIFIKYYKNKIDFYKINKDLEITKI